MPSELGRVREALLAHRANVPRLAQVRAHVALQGGGIVELLRALLARQPVLGCPGFGYRNVRGRGADRGALTTSHRPDAQARILISPDAVGTVCQARVQALAFLCFLARSAPSSSDARCRFDVLSSLDDDESLLDITRLRRVCGAFPCEAGVRQTSTKGRRRASRHRRARPPTWPDRNKDRRSARASSADTISVMRSAPSLAFALTFLAYVALHAERKAYTNVKSAAVADWHMTPDALSVLDTTFMLTYAVCSASSCRRWRRLNAPQAGLYASGALGDATSPKTVLLGGLLASTFIVMAIGLAGSLGAHLVVVALMALNGLAQSTVWPNAVAIMAAHFPEASRGSIMGVWYGAGMRSLREPVR